MEGQKGIASSRPVATVQKDMFNVLSRCVFETSHVTVDVNGAKFTESTVQLYRTEVGVVLDNVPLLWYSLLRELHMVNLTLAHLFSSKFCKMEAQR